MFFIVQKWIMWKSNLSKNKIVKKVSIIQDERNYINVIIWDWRGEKNLIFFEQFIEWKLK